MRFTNKLRLIGLTALTLVFFSMMQKSAHAQKATIKTDEVKIYTLPMIDDKPLQTLAQGDTVQVIGQRGDWVKVESTSNVKGWIQLEVMSLENPSAETEPQKEERPQGQLSMASAYIEADDSERAPENAMNRTQKPAVLPDLIRKKPETIRSDAPYRRFGYTFGAGILEEEFTYNWKFIFHQTPRMALEGSFKHALGEAASSYFIFANLNYMLTPHIRRKFLPYASVGAGLINTVPENSIDVGRGVSNMAINYGFGARKQFKGQLSFVFNISQYSVFINKGVTHFREFTLGLLVGKFWD